MNPHRISRLLLPVAVLLLASLACLTPTPNPTGTPSPFSPTPEPQTMLFANDVLTVAYAEGMLTFDTGDPAFIRYTGEYDLGGELAAGLAHPSWVTRDGSLTSSIGVYRHPIPAGSSLEAVMEEAYKQALLGKPIPEEVPELSGPITLDYSAYEGQQRTIRVASGPLWYTLRDIWFINDGTLYRVSLWNEYNAPSFEGIANLFLLSLLIREDLPPWQPGPTPVPTATATPYPAALLTHFENEYAAFDHPQDWTAYNPGDPGFTCYPEHELAGDLIAGLGDPSFLTFEKYHRSVRLFRLQMPEGSNLEVIHLEAYRKANERLPLQPGLGNEKSIVQMAGLDALQKTYRVYSGEPAYELQDIWTQRGDELFVLAIWTIYTNPDDFALFRSGAGAVVSSLVLK